MASRTKHANLKFDTLDQLILFYLQGKRKVDAHSGSTEQTGSLSSLAVEAFTLSREIELWLTTTVEGRAWAVKQLSSDLPSSPKK